MSTTDFSPAITQAVSLSAAQLAFPCDPERGRLLYHAVKDRLVESFRQIAAASAAVAEIDEARFTAFLDCIARSRKISPRFFAIYYEILVAADEDEVDAVSSLSAQLVSEDTVDSVPSYNLTDADLARAIALATLVGPIWIRNTP